MTDVTVGEADLDLDANSDDEEFVDALEALCMKGEYEGDACNIGSGKDDERVPEWSHEHAHKPVSQQANVPQDLQHSENILNEQQFTEAVMDSEGDKVTVKTNSGDSTASSSGLGNDTSREPTQSISLSDELNKNRADECNDSEEEEEEINVIKEKEELLKIRDADLSEEQLEAFKQEALDLKSKGNSYFVQKDYDNAIGCYSDGLDVCPLRCVKERSIMFSNRAACKLHKDDTDGAIDDCSKALDLHPNYTKALLRRAELYEKSEKLEEALSDYQKALELDPTMTYVRQTCLRLNEEIKERNEKLKAEMLGKLKDLGNMVLKPFGLSTNNFQLQQNPETGSYSVNFQPNAPAATTRQPTPSRTEPSHSELPTWATNEGEQSSDDEEN